ncbi:MAG TPA: ribonuclease P protein component [Flavisolibacter sp.]|nr:ribonuclease P protein component [Flavisolibacter sp.]
MRGAFCYFEKRNTIRQYTLHKQERLKKRKVIEAIFREGISFGAYPFRVFYLKQARETDADSLLQFGVAVSKKYFKKAVDRNRIKRQIREIYRVEKLSLKARLETEQQTLQLFFVYTGKEKTAFALLQSKLQHILQRLEKDLFDN